MAGTPLYEDAKAGRFFRASELENLEEERRLLQLMEWEGQRVAYDGFHDCITFRVRGRLPGKRRRCSESWDGAIKVMEEKEPVFAWAERIPDAVILKE